MDQDALIRELREIKEAAQSLHDPDKLKAAIREVISEDSGDHGGTGKGAARTDGGGGEEAASGHSLRHLLAQRAPDGQVAELHRLADRVHLVSRMTGRAPNELKCWEPYKKLAGELCGRAMNTSDDSAFVPTGFTDSLIDTARIDRRIPGLVNQFSLARSPLTLPVGSDLGLPVKIAEPTTDTAQKIPAQDPATGSVTFDATTYGVRVPFSEEFDEDSIVTAEEYIRSRIAKCMVDGLETGIINGDTAATHQDTAVVTAANDIRKLWLGFRGLAFDNSATYDCAETSIGAADFEQGDVVRTVAKLDDAYKSDPSKVILIFSVGAMYAALSNSADWDAFLTLDKIGPQAINVTGEFGSLYGHPVVTSAYISKTLAATGLGTSTSTYTGIVAFNRDAWALAVQRAVTLTTIYDAETLQYKVIGHSRADFRAYRPSDKVSAFGYKITPV
ncbi:MAG: hypothetical protein MOGMAGMI_02473 [Candidatus Omnitrophica bacterium]|nr:hypothetical protein [Candidatus Omnitrophota bacterium]